MLVALLLTAAVLPSEPLADCPSCRFVLRAGEGASPSLPIQVLDTRSGARVDIVVWHPDQSGNLLLTMNGSMAKLPSRVILPPVGCLLEFRWFAVNFR